PETHALSEKESLCGATDSGFAGKVFFSKPSGISEDTEEKEKSLSVWERYDERRRLLHERIEAFKKKYGDGAGTERTFPEGESVKEAAKPREEAIASWMGPDAPATKKEEETLPEEDALGGIASVSRFLEKEEEDPEKEEERKLPSDENTYITSFEKSSDMAEEEEAAKARKIGQMPLSFSPEPEKIDGEPFPERFSRENDVFSLSGRKDASEAAAKAPEKFAGEKKAGAASEEHGARHIGEGDRKTLEAENMPASKIKKDISKKVCPRSFFPGAPEDGELFSEGGEKAGGDEKKAPGFFLRAVKAAGKFMREFFLPEDLGKGENEKAQKKTIAKKGAPAPAAEKSFLPSPEKEEAPKRELATEPKSYDRPLDEYETADAWYCYAMRNLSRENGYLGIKDFSSQLKKIRREDNDLYREIVRDDTHTVFSGNRGRMGAEEYLWEIYWNIYSAENRDGDLSRAAREKFMRERADRLDYVPEGVKRRNEYTAKMLAAEAEKRREEDRKMAEERKRREEKRRKLTKGGLYDGK
ncbi:MAG: hypothetical protein LUD29_00960, partial [Clostridia bacterium]|nr:hypothetical protein [Clostridia bacterium]